MPEVIGIDLATKKHRGNIAAVLMEAKQNAENYLGETVTQAVAAVPVYFTYTQRQAVRDIAALTGLKILRIVNAPVAACLGYDVHRTEEVNILVCSSDGESFEAALLDVDGGVFEVLAVAGDSKADANRVIELTQQVLEDAGLNAGDIDKILLVGETEEMSAFEFTLTEIFGQKPVKADNPGKCTAKGAAILAGIMKGKYKNLVLVDVMPSALGVETAGGVMTTIIKRNTAMPALETKILRLTANEQSQFEISVFQGESYSAKNNAHIGKFILDGITAEPESVNNIEVTFTLDTGGVLSVSARQH